MTQKSVLSPPRFVQNDRGEIVEVIVSLEDYRQLLRTLAEHADWESLPPHLQDAIDHLLAEDAKAEKGPSQPLRDVLGEFRKPS